MPDEKAPDDAKQGERKTSLIDVLLQVANELRREPLFLAALGGGVLIGIFAQTGPKEFQTATAAIVVLLVVAMLLWFVLKFTSRVSAGVQSGSIQLGWFARVVKSNVTTGAVTQGTGSGRSGDVKFGMGSKAKDSTFRTGDVGGSDRDRNPR